MSKLIFFLGGGAIGEMYCLQYSENVYLIIVDGDGMQILNTKGLNRSNSAINAHTIKGTSLAWKLLRRNSVRPEEKNMKQLLEAFKKKSRPYVLNPKYSTPTSLPLYFYFGYQLLQESELMKKCGHVRYCVSLLR